jgi:hypothetical protein
LPVSKEVVWPFNSNHTISVSHPAHQEETISITTPSDSDHDLIFNTQAKTGVQWKKGPNGYTISIRLIPNYLKVWVRSKPPGAKVFINNVNTQKVTPFEFSFATGTNSQVRFEKDGYENMELAFLPDPFKPIEPLAATLVKSQLPTPTPVPASAKDQPKPTSTAVPKPQQGKLQIKSPFAVDVYSGKKKIASKVTQKTIMLPAGKSTLVFKNETAFVEISKTVTIKPDKIESVTLDALGRMIVDADPPGCEVMIMDKSIGTAPGEFELAPGTYNVSFVWKDCEKKVSQWVRISSEQNKRLPKITGCK